MNYGVLCILCGPNIRSCCNFSLFDIRAVGGPINAVSNNGAGIIITPVVALLPPPTLPPPPVPCLAAVIDGVVPSTFLTSSTTIQPLRSISGNVTAFVTMLATMNDTLTVTVTVNDSKIPNVHHQAGAVVHCLFFNLVPDFCLGFPSLV